MTNNDNRSAAATPTGPAADPRPLLARALDQAGNLVTTTSPDRSGDPTPCSEFDIGALIGHLHGVVRRIGAVVSGRPFATVATDTPSSDWVADWESARAETDRALAEADLSQPVTVPWGEVPTASAIGSYIGELATHAWDLAAATGRTGDLDPAIAEAALPQAMAMIPAQIRDLPDIPFGPVVEVPDDAPAYDRLVGWNGRDPRWAPIT